MQNNLDHEEITQIRTINILNIVFGAWLVIAPYVLSFDKTAAIWNEIVTAVIVITFAGIRYARPQIKWASWVTGIGGIWLILSPFFFTYSKASAYWNQIIFGILIAIIAYSNMNILHSHSNMRHMAQ